ncbi:helix-turn-helix domain-containing protein [Goodfellowiella coeruleoviolacea]|uniref:PucR C-terminal helix-turn-helix domain-containing protein n=1 Tax=Goodfellowiella coeruleoviolacea TaxID=334858 RepID=A0AAE3GCZ6_9PSEU|nr:helix-turn-helix domain-containing protein [Goodfellowiella coeruleoviolacea]MCP2163888.1 PucR C-terminal helix-turn-helix domain-containing protein [Goodfellowiella coeruleoviolacea]
MTSEAPAAHAGTAANPWAGLPRELAPALAAEIPGLATAILRQIQQHIPEYARPLEGPFGRAITEGIEHALRQFVEKLANPAAPRDLQTETYRRLGRAEFREGRGLDTLQAAYRLGARVSWRWITGFAIRANLSVRTMALFGEAVFAHVDELAALTVEGYVAAKASAAGTLQLRRRRLLDLVLTGGASPSPALTELARTAQWELPARVRAVALARQDARPRPVAASPGPDLPRAGADQHPGRRRLPPTRGPAGPHRPLSAGLDPRVLADLEGDAPLLLVPEDADGPWLRHALRPGWRAAVGPVVDLAAAARSLAWARQALSLVAEGVLPDERPVLDCAPHLSTLWLLDDRFLTTELVSRTLAPFARLTAKQRVKLRETLLVWLETRSISEVGSRLGVHPQTVRYRVRQLEELFGDRLDDPAARFDLELALRASRLLGRGAPLPDAGR